MSKRKSYAAVAGVVGALTLGLLVWATIYGACGDATTPGLVRELTGWLLPWCG